MHTRQKLGSQEDKTHLTDAALKKRREKHKGNTKTDNKVEMIGNDSSPSRVF